MDVLFSFSEGSLFGPVDDMEQLLLGRSISETDRSPCSRPSCVSGVGSSALGRLRSTEIGNQTYRLRRYPSRSEGAANRSAEAEAEHMAFRHERPRMVAYAFREGKKHPIMRTRGGAALLLRGELECRNHRSGAGSGDHGSLLCDKVPETNKEFPGQPLPATLTRRRDRVWPAR